MKYYTLLIQKFDDGTSKKSVYEFDTKKEALANFHKGLGSAMASDTVTHVLCIVLDDYGIIYQNEHFPEEQYTSLISNIPDTPIWDCYGY